MPARDKLSALAVKNAAYGKHYDGAGLFLRVDQNGTGRWVFRFRLYGRQREMGLGSRDAVSLKNARIECDRWRGVVASGHDPIRQREKEARERAADRPTLEAVTMACFEARKASLRGGGKAGRWLSPLKLHVLPRLGGVRADRGGDAERYRGNAQNNLARKTGDSAQGDQPLGACDEAWRCNGA